MQENKEKYSNFFERISNIMDFYGINSVKSFACDWLGYDSSEKINRLKKIGNNPSFEILNDISNKFDNINVEWLITGNGPMLKKNNQSKNDYSNLDNIGLIKDLIDKIGELSVQLGEQTKENEHLYQKNMELQSKINELKEGMGDRWNKSPRRDPVYSHPDIAAEPGPEE